MGAHIWSPIYGLCDVWRAMEGYGGRAMTRTFASSRASCRLTWCTPPCEIITALVGTARETYLKYIPWVNTRKPWCTSVPFNLVRTNNSPQPPEVLKYQHSLQGVGLVKALVTSLTTRRRSCTSCCKCCCYSMSCSKPEPQTPDVPARFIYYGCPYGYPYMVTHIWLHIYGCTYMNIHTTHYLAIGVNVLRFSLSSCSC